MFSLVASILSLSVNACGVPKPGFPSLPVKDRFKDDRYKLETMERRLKQLIQENHNLRRKLENKLLGKIDASEIKDILICQICHDTVSAPFILPKCGHTFCRDCLCEWFEVSLSAHLRYYSASYRPDIPQSLASMLRRAPILKDRLAELFSEGPQPNYTCPVCRQLVIQRPVEVMVITDLVRLLVRRKKVAEPDEFHGDPWAQFFRN